MSQLGPAAERVYLALRERIVSGELAPGFKLPPHQTLAVDFGVAPWTLRQAQAQLETEGYLSREPGRGTFVRIPSIPSVLILEPEALSESLLQDRARQAGYAVRLASDARSAFDILEQDRRVRLVVANLRVPTTREGIAFVRSVWTRWSTLPIVLVLDRPEDIEGLRGRPECPVLILHKPLLMQSVDLVMQQAPPLASRIPPRLPVLLVGTDKLRTSPLSRSIAALGFHTEAVENCEQGREALQSRQFGHVFVDMATLQRTASGCDAIMADIAREHPVTVFVAVWPDARQAPRVLRQVALPVVYLPDQGSGEVLRRVLQLGLARGV